MSHSRGPDCYFSGPVGTMQPVFCLQCKAKSFWTVHLVGVFTAALCCCLIIRRCLWDLIKGPTSVENAPAENTKTTDPQEEVPPLCSKLGGEQSKPSNVVSSFPVALGAIVEIDHK